MTAGRLFNDTELSSRHLDVLYALAFFSNQIFLYRPYLILLIWSNGGAV